MLAWNVMKKYGFGQNNNDRDIQAKLNIFVMQECTFCPFSKRTWRTKREYYFILNSMRNLHSRSQTRSCWKRDASSCHFKLPKLPSEQDSHVGFHDDVNFLRYSVAWNSRMWYTFQVITNWVHSDVYVIFHHSWTSFVLGFNTNIQIGLDDKAYHVLYLVLYW